MKNQSKKFLSIFFLILGIFLTILLLKEYNFQEILEYIALLKWKILIILFLPIVWYYLQSLAWYLTISESKHHVSIWHLLQIKLIGEAANTITPVSFVGGDPLRFYLLQKKMPKTLSTTSVLLDRTMQTVSVIAFLLVGLLLGWIDLKLEGVLSYALPITIVVLIFFGIFLILSQRRGSLGRIFKLISKIGIKKLKTKQLEEKIVEIDERIISFYSQDKKRFWSVFFLHFLSRVVGIYEILFIGQFFKIDLGFEKSWMLASISVLVNIVFVFIPGSLGVMEGAYGKVLKLMGFSETIGISIQLVRRIRVLFWILVGLILIFINKKTRQK